MKKNKKSTINKYSCRVDEAKLISWHLLQVWDLHYFQATEWISSLACLYNSSLLASCVLFSITTGSSFNMVLKCSFCIIYNTMYYFITILAFNPNSLGHSHVGLAKFFQSDISVTWHSLLIRRFTINQHCVGQKRIYKLHYKLF